MSVDVDHQADLDRLLEHGPFPVALRAAIVASGLPLDRIRHHLALRGAAVSVPTLSLWQSGRRRPARAESLRALGHLEQVLGVRPGALAALLGPSKPRGRRADGVLAVSQHDLVAVDAGGRISTVHSRTVLLASGAGADRWTVSWELPDGQAPEVVAQRHCRVSRIDHDLDRRSLTAELVLDAPLADGESLTLEYLAVSGKTAGRGQFVRLLDRPTRDYVLEAGFETLPARCVRLHQPVEAPAARFRPLVPGPSGSVHLAEADVSGRIGIRWEI
ncbi:hypothetical protein SAMN05421504_103123 [Amycolatopsis xylanica]|uniref:Uncharacterized protein n=1 Tax=Amycolatopsis xylanica TaxID=589385 RepID=A0A1H3CR39_9PSEU|nr:hypothetical protein [Amycolatopsis xylanica]SDX56702.1 hypothetical protein SAMN05421504_103123 [Amycolatopsis xylanica]